MLVLALTAWTAIAAGHTAQKDSADEKLPLATLAATEPELDEAAPPRAPAATGAPAATAAPSVTASADAFQPLVVDLAAAVDVPTGGRYPMASARVGVRYELHMPLAVLGVGLRTGYSYAAGSGPVLDARLGTDPAGYLAAHEIPVLAVGVVGLRADKSPFFDVPVRLTVQGGAGPEIVVGEAHSFGRTAALFAVVPALSIGAAIDWELGPSFRFGVFGAWDTAFVDLSSSAPGVSGDLSAARLGVGLGYAWGA